MAEMKLQLGRIVLALDSGALQALTSQKPQNKTGQERSKFAYRLGSIRSALVRFIDERSVYYTHKRDLETAHFDDIEFTEPGTGEKKLRREFKSPMAEHRRAYGDALEGLLLAEVDANVPTVTLDELADFGIELTPEQMSLLSFCIVEPAEAEQATASALPA